jgi:hypothetical protein
MKMLLAHQDNLLGKVKLENPRDALGFVRFFSSRPTSALLHAGGCVEVMSGKSPGGLFYAVEPLVFRRHFKEAQSEVQGSDGRGDLAFITTRAVVCMDQSVYELREQVYSDGMYFELSRKRILKKASQVGIVHVPPH